MWVGFMVDELLLTHLPYRVWPALTIAPPGFYSLFT